MLNRKFKMSIWRYLRKTKRKKNGLSQEVI